jgi:hypothetical protein
MPFTDTSAEVSAMMDARYRRMSTTQKLEHAMALRQFAHSLILTKIRAEFPSETDRQHRIRMSTRWLTREQLIRAFKWDPQSALSPPP